MPRWVRGRGAELFSLRSASTIYLVAIVSPSPVTALHCGDITRTPCDWKATCATRDFDAWALLAAKDEHIVLD